MRFSLFSLRQCIIKQLLDSVFVACAKGADGGGGGEFRGKGGWGNQESKGRGKTMSLSILPRFLFP